MTERARLIKAWLTLILLLGALLLPSHLRADSGTEVEASPNPPRDQFLIPSAPEQASERSLGEALLMWLPNRLFDLYDIFRLDVGAGPAYGAAVRVTRPLQFGYRVVSPASVRIGAFGRNAPYLLETSSEFGAGPAYVESKDRKVCNLEVGAGVDLLLGIYGGICLEEVADFAAGIFFLDLSGDDF
ncbi:MAG: hypothetical protein DCC75_06130 [Proteobacteria bacterium]|nr:MAG: hypothetical protein DCC75_06130 [Pseudomonadota bacterium]